MGFELPLVNCIFASAPNEPPIWWLWSIINNAINSLLNLNRIVTPVQHIEQISEIWLNLRMQTKEVSSFCFRSIVICFVFFFMWNSLGIYMVSMHHNEQCKVCRICSVIQSTVKLLSLCIGWSCVRHQPTQYTALLRKNGNYFDFRNWFALLRFFFLNLFSYILLPVATMIYLSFWNKILTTFHTEMMARRNWKQEKFAMLFIVCVGISLRVNSATKKLFCLPKLILAVKLCSVFVCVSTINWALYEFK